MGEAAVAVRCHGPSLRRGRPVSSSDPGVCHGQSPTPDQGRADERERDERLPTVTTSPVDPCSTAVASARSWCTRSAATAATTGPAPRPASPRCAPAGPVAGPTGGRRRRRAAPPGPGGAGGSREGQEAHRDEHSRRRQQQRRPVPEGEDGEDPRRGHHPAEATGARARPRGPSRRGCVRGSGPPRWRRPPPRCTSRSRRSCGATRRSPGIAGRAVHGGIIRTYD